MTEQEQTTRRAAGKGGAHRRASRRPPGPPSCSWSFLETASRSARWPGPPRQSPRPWWRLARRADPSGRAPGTAPPPRGTGGRRTCCCSSPRRCWSRMRARSNVAAQWKTTGKRRLRNLPQQKNAATSAFQLGLALDGALAQTERAARGRESTCMSFTS